MEGTPPTALPQCRIRNPPYHVAEGDSTVSYHATAQLFRRRGGSLTTTNECKSVGASHCRVALPLGARAQHGGGGGDEVEEEEEGSYF